MTKPEAQGHTPLPWMLDHDDRPRMEWNIHIVQEAAPAMRICFMTSDGPSEANAALIVTAVNSHASLKQRVEELERLLEPFAKFANRFGGHGREDNWVLTNNPSGKGNLTMGDVRAARTALSSRGET